jgi:hypothetical protein
VHFLVEVEFSSATKKDFCMAIEEKRNLQVSSSSVADECGCRERSSSSSSLQTPLVCSNNAIRLPFIFILSTHAGSLVHECNLIAFHLRSIRISLHRILACFIVPRRRRRKRRLVTVRQPSLDGTVVPPDLRSLSALILFIRFTTSRGCFIHFTS